MSVTPQSDSHTTSADTPPASPNKLAGRMTESKRTSEPIHPDFPDAKLLLISCKRPRSFFERTVRELLAGGTEVVVLSSLGDAIPMCVQLQSSLEEKKAAVHVKIETTYSPLGQKNNGPPTAGLRIYMKKHPEFKGSRISPGYVSFSEEVAEGETPIYDTEPKDRCGSVNCGDHQLYVGGGGCNAAFAELLAGAGQKVENYQSLHKALLEKAIKENEDKESDLLVRAAQVDDLDSYNCDVKMALCRCCNALKGKEPTGATGSVFLTVFKDTVVPHGKDRNMAMVYVVGPRGTDFPDKEYFLDAVHRTAVNLMTILCDYNGVVRRQGSQKLVQRLNTCRISLFSGGLYKHPDVTQQQVASSIISGLEEGYRHGPAPRLNFAHAGGVFKQVWIESTGLDIYDDEAKNAPA